MYLGTGKETPINYFRPLSDPAEDNPNDITNEDTFQNERPVVNHERIEEMDVDENETFVENRQEKVDANLLNWRINSTQLPVNLPFFCISHLWEVWGA